jgi:hypothetical protein
MDPYLFFYDFCKLTDLRKLTVRFYLKKVNWPDLTRTWADPAPVSPTAPILTVKGYHTLGW